MDGATEIDPSVLPFMPGQGGRELNPAAERRQTGCKIIVCVAVQSLHPPRVNNTEALTEGSWFGSGSF